MDDHGPSVEKDKFLMRYGYSLLYPILFSQFWDVFRRSD